MAMKNKARFYKVTAGVSVLVAAAMLFVLLATGVFAEDTAVKATNSSVASYEIEDTNPAIYVAQKNANSVVGVITNVEMWTRGSSSASTETYSEGSGVAIADGGYILTNYHVVASGDSYQVLMPSGDKVDATLIGYDSSYDLAVLKVDDESAASTLVPVAIGSVEKMYVGSTVVAIGNPGGETLYNTVTQGIISSLSRDVDGGNTSRSVDYIQHDAAINSGNSGGGLFDINGNIIGINTLKYSGSYYSGSTYEGLGFAIPIDTAYPIAVELIEKGKIERVGIGVSVTEVEGVDEATDTEAPTGLYVQSLLSGGPAETAGIEVGDYIVAIDDTRVTTTEDLTSVIDQHKAGDVVTITVVRYTAADGSDENGGFTKTDSNTSGGYYNFGSGDNTPFGGYFNQQPTQNYTAQTMKIDVTLQVLD
jgi:serine protease Do